MLGSVFLAGAILVAVPGLDVANEMFGTISAEVEARQTYVMATVNLWIDPNGSIVECRNGRAVGTQEIAAGFCSMLLGRQIDKPRDEHGRQTYAYVPYTMSGFANSRMPQSNAVIDALLATPNVGDPDERLPVSHPSVVDGTRFFIELSIAADGSVTACERSKGLPRRLVALACAAARERTFAVRTASGQPVAYVRTVRLVASS